MLIPLSTPRTPTPYMLPQEGVARSLGPGCRLPARPALHSRTPRHRRRREPRQRPCLGMSGSIGVGRVGIVGFFGCGGGGVIAGGNGSGNGGMGTGYGVRGTGHGARRRLRRQGRWRRRRRRRTAAAAAVAVATATARVVGASAASAASAAVAAFHGGWGWRRRRQRWRGRRRRRQRRRRAGGGVAASSSAASAGWRRGASARGRIPAAGGAYPPAAGTRHEESNLEPRQLGAAGADHHRGRSAQPPCQAAPSHGQPGQATAERAAQRRPPKGGERPEAHTFDSRVMAFELPTSGTAPTLVQPESRAALLTCLGRHADGRAPPGSR